MINKRHHTQRFCLGGNTGNDHTDRQTGGRAGGRTAGLSDICKDVFNLGIVLSCEISRKNRVQRPDSPVISIIGKHKASELLQQVSNTQECACIL